MTHERLPNDDGFRGARVKVTAISGDWVKIEAVTAVPEHGIAAVPAGWIETADIFFVMQTSTGFARPNAKSEKVFATDDWIYRKAIHNIHDCRGGWLKLTISGDYEEREGEMLTRVTAWFRGFCGNAETTCDGVDYE